MMEKVGNIEIFGLKFKLTNESVWWVLPALPLVFAISFVVVSFVFYSICELTGLMTFSHMNCIYFFVTMLFLYWMLVKIFGKDED